MTEKNPNPLSRNAIMGTEGEFSGWWTQPSDVFATLTGPFWSRVDENGNVRSAFRAERKHLNSVGYIHGGCYTVFVDYFIFALAAKELGDDSSVTVALNCEFLSAAREGALVEATGEIIRSGRSLIFLRGILASSNEPLLSFSSTIKRIKARTV